MYRHQKKYIVIKTNIIFCFMFFDDHVFFLMTHPGVPPPLDINGCTTLGCAPASGARAVLGRRLPDLPFGALGQQTNNRQTTECGDAIRLFSGRSLAV